MVWLAFLGLSALALAPVAWVLRGTVSARGRRDPALALHRAQLVELDRDLGEGRLSAPDHGLARLEVQRRMLAEAARDDVAPVRASRGPLLAAMLLVPVLSVGLYLVAGRPDLPAAPLAARLSAANGRLAEDDRLLGELRQSIARLAPNSDQARQGLMLLGQSEATLGHWGDAAAAWRRALGIRFDPTVAFEVAEATTRAQGRVDAESAGLFRQALAAEPADAPWHGLAVQRLAESEHH